MDVSSATVAKEATAPDGRALVGRWVRLAPIGAADFAELAEILADPRVYEHGYLMHRRPSSPADAAAHAARGPAPNAVTSGACPRGRCTRP